MKPINRFSLLHDPIIHDRLNKMVEQLNGNLTELEAARHATSLTIASQAATITSLAARIVALEQNSGTIVIQEVAATTPATPAKKAPVPPKKKAA
jgi:hypothetical protein